MSGLQELMAAEQRAQQIVADARAERGDKMRQAKVEAQQIIEDYRREKEMQLAASSEGINGVDSELASLQLESEAQLQTLNAEFSANKAKAVDFLVETVTSVDIRFMEDNRRE